MLGSNPVRAGKSANTSLSVPIARHTSTVSGRLFCCTSVSPILTNRKGCARGCSLFSSSTFLRADVLNHRGVINNEKEELQ
jgi:hypothetical protein